MRGTSTADAKEEALGAVEELITCMGEKIRTNIAAAIEDRLALVPEQVRFYLVQNSSILKTRPRIYMPNWSNLTFLVKKNQSISFEHTLV